MSNNPWTSRHILWMVFSVRCSNDTQHYIVEHPNKSKGLVKWCAHRFLVCAARRHDCVLPREGSWGVCDLVYCQYFFVNSQAQVRSHTTFVVSVRLNCECIWIVRWLCRAWWSYVCMYSFWVFYFGNCKKHQAGISWSMVLCTTLTMLRNTCLFKAKKCVVYIYDKSDTSMIYNSYPVWHKLHVHVLLNMHIKEGCLKLEIK